MLFLSFVLGWKKRKLTKEWKNLLIIANKLQLLLRNSSILYFNPSTKLEIT